MLIVVLAIADDNSVLWTKGTIVARAFKISKNEGHRRFKPKYIFSEQEVIELVKRIEHYKLVSMLMTNDSDVTPANQNVFVSYESSFKFSNTCGQMPSFEKLKPNFDKIEIKKEAKVWSDSSIESSSVSAEASDLSDAELDIICQSSSDSESNFWNAELDFEENDECLKVKLIKSDPSNVYIGTQSLRQESDCAHLRYTNRIKKRELKYEDKENQSTYTYFQSSF